MTDRITRLQDTITHACIGYDYPEIMAALTMVTGAMIGLHSTDRGHAQAGGQAACAAVMMSVDLVFDQDSGVH